MQRACRKLHTNARAMNEVFSCHCGQCRWLLRLVEGGRRESDTAKSVSVATIYRNGNHSARTRWNWPDELAGRANKRGELGNGKRRRRRRRRRRCCGRIISPGPACSTLPVCRLPFSVCRQRANSLALLTGWPNSVGGILVICACPSGRPARCLSLSLSCRASMWPVLLRWARRTAHRVLRNLRPFPAALKARYVG